MATEKYTSVPYKKVTNKDAPSELDSILALAESDPEAYAPLLKEYKKKKTPKMSALQRVVTGLSAFETADAAYKAHYEKKSFVKEQATNSYQALKQAVTGRVIEGLPQKKTYKDILVKEGMKDRKGKVDLVDVVGLGGDILLDPSTYLGGFVGKGVKYGAKGVGKLAAKIPILEQMGSAASEMFRPEIQKAFKPLLESADPMVQRYGRKGLDILTKYKKGTATFLEEAIVPIKDLEKKISKLYGADGLAKIGHAAETGLKTGDEVMDDAARQLGEMNKSLLEAEKRAGIKVNERDNYIRHLATPEFREFLDKSGGSFTNLPKPIRTKLDFMKERQFGNIVGADGKVVTGNYKKLGYKKINPAVIIDEVKRVSQKKVEAMEKKLNSYLKPEVDVRLEKYVDELDFYKSNIVRTPVSGKIDDLLEPSDKELNDLVNSIVAPKRREISLKTMDAMKQAQLSQGAEVLKGPIVPKVSRLAKAKQLKKEIDNYKIDISHKMNEIFSASYIKDGKFFKSQPINIKEANEWSMKTLIDPTTKKPLGIKMFEENPFKATAARIVESEKAVRTRTLLNDIKYLMGRADVVENEVRDGLKWVKSTAPELQGALYPENVAKYLDTTSKIFNNADETAKFLRAYDTVLGLWKGSVYGWLPQSHTTNMIGGMFNNYVAGVNPTMYAIGEKVLASMRKADKVRGKIQGTVRLKGREIPLSSVVQWAKETGVLGSSGRFDLPTSLNTFGKEATKLEKVGSALSKYPRAAMGAVEDRVRLPLFLDGLARKLSPGDAAKRVIKYHFDYTPEGLGKFENDIMRRLIPFYVFSRNVIPLTINTLLLQPQKYNNAFKLARAMGYSATSEESINKPDYLKEQIMPKIGGMEMAGLKLPIEAGLQLAGNPLRGLGVSLSPFLKQPIEALTGKNIFKNKDIKDDTYGKDFIKAPKFIKDYLQYREIEVPANEKTGRPGYTKYMVNPERKYVIENFLFLSRIVKIAQKTSQGPEDKQNYLSLITSLKGYEQTLDENKQYRERELIRDLRDTLIRLGGAYMMEKLIIPKEKQAPVVPKIYKKETPTK